MVVNHQLHLQYITIMVFFFSTQTAQNLVREVLENADMNKTFEASSYQAQTRANIAAEKINIISSYLQQIKSRLDADTNVETLVADTNVENLIAEDISTIKENGVHSTEA